MSRPAFAQTPVHWSVAAQPATSVAAGGTITVTATARIDAGWHVYSLTQPPGGPRAMVVTLAASDVFTATGPATSPAPHTAFDPNFNMETEYYETSVDVRLPVRVAKAAPAGAARIAVTIAYQTCNERLCLPPAEETIATAIEIEPPTVARERLKVQAEPSTVPAEPASVPPPSSARVVPDLAASSSRASSLPAYVGLAAAMGFLSLLTPCVFPMVPITVSYFTARAGRTRREAVTQALIYGAGIVFTFSGAGLALALVAGAAGLNQFAANPWVNLGITALFLGFALSLFGRMNVSLPSHMVTRAVGAQQRWSGYAGTLLMGFAFTLTSFTCTAPFLGSLLVVAATGDWQWPLAGMLAFSTVFALPFVVLALVPQRLAAMPRAGAWLQSVKSAMGLLEVAAALKFLSNADLVWGWGVFTREVVLAGWILVAIALVWQFARARSGLRPVWRVALALSSLALAVWLTAGLRGMRLGELEAFLPPADARVLAAGREPDWIVNDYAAALETARREGRPVLVDFTGYTCTNCRWMEANMFPRPDVALELARFVRVRLYTDGQGEPYAGFQRMQRETYGTVALPYYAALAPDGTPRVAFGGLTRDAGEFIAFLRAGLH